MPQTGATRYQKFLKSEKAKTKLKVKKKDLPKGTNVTKTNFKVKKIVIKEQLKKHGENEALSSKKLNIKELLSRLNHFNSNSRTEALAGLKELITNTDILSSSLSQFIYGVSPLILNIEKIIRREALSVIHLVLSNVSIEKIDPFFNILSTYLRSAMTHIDNRIQEDSLLFLDILFLCAPEKMVQDFHKIVPNFLDMISKLRLDSKPGRTLTVNLESQITSVKWRVKVLQRLKDFFTKFVEYHKINIIEKKTAVPMIKYDENRLNYYPLNNKIFTSVCNLTCFSSNNMQTSPVDEIEKFKQYIDTLMPLLFETWLEACPNINTEKNIETVISEDAASLLQQSLGAVSLLWDIVQYYNQKNQSTDLQTSFSQKYKQSFCQHFVTSFPYVTNIRSKQDTNNSITDQKLVIENLEICYIYIKFNPNINVKNKQAEVSTVINYIEKTLYQKADDTVNNVVIKILNCLYSDKVSGWTKNVAAMNTLFKKIIWAYFNKNVTTNFRQKIYTLLCQIALNEKLSHMHKTEEYVKWINHLPDIMLENTISARTIDIIYKFAICNNNTFNLVIKPKLHGIIQNLPELTITDCDIYTNSYQKLFSLLYWIRCWDNESLDLLEKQLMENVYKSNHSNVIYDTLQLRSANRNE